MLTMANDESSPTRQTLRCCADEDVDAAILSWIEISRKCPQINVRAIELKPEQVAAVQRPDQL